MQSKRLKIPKNQLLLVGGLFVFYILLLSSAGFRDPTWGLPLTLVIIPLVATGLLEVKKAGRPKFWKVSLSALLVLEFAYFAATYKTGLSENQFSKRNTIYNDLSRQVSIVSKNYDKIFITSRLDNAKIYFDFYTPELESKSEYKDYDLKKDSNPNTLFVGVLPFEPSPSEPLYRDEGNWPEYIGVFDVIKDTKHKQDVVVFSSRL